MRRKALVKVAASSLIVAVTMVGCTGAAYRSHPAFAGEKAAPSAPAFAASAEAALAKRNFAVALTAAESAVAAQPDSADYRTLLGRAYLANGRFLSAETAFGDAMTLGNADARTIVSLALIKVAQGNAPAARALLNDNMDRVPAADYGLAMAMAGDPDEGVRILGQAVHDPSADAKTRQNLAYAYALAGQWREARMMALQDVDPAMVAQRLLKWAETAQPGAEPMRVAALLGVSPRPDDTGIPAQLALAPSAPAPARMAEAAPETPAASVEPAPIAASAPASAAAVPASGIVMAARREIVQPLPGVTPPASVDVPSFRPVARPAPRKAAFVQPAPTSGSAWVVQLGAYDSAAVAGESWKRMARSNSRIGAFTAVNSTATVEGRLYHRLAISGFGDRQSADRLCRSLRAGGGQCFVREGGSEVRMAMAKAPATSKPAANKQLASR